MDSRQLFMDVISGCSYRCEKCNTLMFCDKTLISNHFKNLHNVFLKTDGVTKCVPQYKQMCQLFLQSLPVSAKTHDKAVVPISEIPFSEITSVIGNLCTFFCPKCVQKYFSSTRKLSKHMKDVHHKEFTFKSRLVHTARYHACLVCPKAILGDRYLLYYHLRNCHKVSLPKYEEVFQRNGGKILPTYRCWLQERKGF